MMAQLASGERKSVNMILVMAHHYDLGSQGFSLEEEHERMYW